MNMPLPQGIGQKSSRILGLDDPNMGARFGSGYNPYFPNGGGKLRQSTRSSSSAVGGGLVDAANGMHCSLHVGGEQGENQDHIYDITKVRHQIFFYIIL